MKIFKLVLPLILLFVLSMPTYALHLPEDKVVDRELTVEEDKNIVENSISKRDPEIKTFVMSSLNYAKMIVLPLFVLVLLGPLALIIEHIKNSKRKRPSKE
jgi:hypothetical protein